MNIVEEKFSKLVSDKKLIISDNPFLVENFIDIKKYISWDILDEAINNDFVWWEIINRNGEKIQIPSKNPYWFRGYEQQNKLFIINCVNRENTFVISKCSILNEKLKSLISSIQNCFHVSADIHIYGSKGAGTSFVPHVDMPANFMIQVEGETKWIVYKNKVSNLLNLHNDFQHDELEPLIETILKPGDLLYVPSRYYHCAFPKSSRLSISIPCLNSETMGHFDVSVMQTDTNIYKI